MLGLELARRMQRLSQTDLGYRALIQQSDVSAIERGRLNPTPEELGRLAHALGVTRPELLLKNFTDLPADEVASAPPDPYAEGLRRR